MAEQVNRFRERVRQISIPKDVSKQAIISNLEGARAMAIRAFLASGLAGEIIGLAMTYGEKVEPYDLWTLDLEDIKVVVKRIQDGYNEFTRSFDISYSIVIWVSEISVANKYVALTFSKLDMEAGEQQILRSYEPTELAIVVPTEKWLTPLEDEIDEYQAIKFRAREAKLDKTIESIKKQIKLDEWSVNDG